MTRHPRTTTLAAGAAVALAMTMVAAQPASARWATHNGNDVTEIRVPRSGTEDQTCAHRLRGRAGWSTNVEAGQPPESVPVPDAAYTRVRYEVWRAPAGFTDFSEAQAVDSDQDGDVDGYSFYDENDNEFPARLVRRFRTPERDDLQPPEPVFEVGPGESNVYVFTAARFSRRLRSVSPGHTLGVIPSDGGSNFLTLRAIRCR